MFGLSGMKIALLGLGALAVVTTIGLGYRHYTNLVDTVTVLSENNARLGIAVELQDNTITEQGEAIGEWSTAQDTMVERVEELASVATEAANETRRLNDIFSRHDLTDLARRRPGMVEPRINRATATALRLLECASGADRPDCPDIDRPPGPDAQHSEPAAN